MKDRSKYRKYGREGRKVGERTVYKRTLVRVLR